MLEALKRWRWGILIAAALVLGLAYSFWPEAEAVDLGTVSEGPMAVGVTDDGVTRVRELYTVTAPVTGYVTRIELEPGDPVVAGETVIARMAGIPSAPLDQRSRSELGNAIAASRAAESAATAQLTLSRAELRRAEALAERGFVSKADLEARRAAASTQRAELARSRAETNRLQSMLASTSGAPAGDGIAVRSPESGVLLRRINESEGVLAQGAPLVEIGDPARIEVAADMLSREAAQIKPGDAVEITRWGGDGILPGRVRTVEPFGTLKVSALGIEEQRVNVIIDFGAAAAQRIARLGHGFQVDATVILWRDDEALRVPVGALFRGEEGEWHVFVANGHRAEMRRVNIGHLNEEFGEVLEGLAADEQVILNPPGTLTDGARIAERPSAGR